LSYLSERIGGRLAGSPEAAAAVEYTYQMLDTMGMDSVWLQPCMVPHWVRGAKEELRVVRSKKGSFPLNAVALGNSIGSGPGGVAGKVVEVHSLDALDSLGRAALEGKIVFFNRPMDPTQVYTFNAYGGAVDQRVFGATRAGKYGAVGAIVRSMTNQLDDIPHTGSTVYEEDGGKIPVVAISTNDAEMLGRLLKDAPVELYLRTDCHILEDKPSYNVIGELKGSEYPDEIILVGGHLDSWDIGGGAHDDGAGCVHAMEVIHLLKNLGYQPKRTIRCVLFMNEENGLAGGKAYWAASNAAGEYHMAAIESDRGGFTPRGFSVDGHESVFNERFSKLADWLPLLKPYGLEFSKGGSGADISGLKDQKGMLFGFLPDSQRYFDFHHTEADVISAVDQRELELGAASMASLVYLLDKYGL
ncbi:MAG: M20/M25/M40 family metallo-hydrolase, partial [Phaeodactylibacter sp.]|nr:M20/M25/M40 family metallo-hydrolase [Phaeodactylibacter sp.]